MAHCAGRTTLPPLALFFSFALPFFVFPVFFPPAPSSVCSGGDATRDKAGARALAGQCFSLFLSRLFLQSSPLIELESFKASPAFAGMLFKSRTVSWAGNMVHDWIGFAADFPVESAFSVRNERDDEQCFQRATFVSLGMASFHFGP
jgi:hypothetical protein